MEFIDESAPEESDLVEFAPEESDLVESAPEESDLVESAPEESYLVESAPEETQAPAELYSAEVVQSLDTLAADLENTNLVLMSFFVVFCIVSLRNIVFGIRKNIFGR